MPRRGYVSLAQATAGVAMNLTAMRFELTESISMGNAPQTNKLLLTHQPDYEHHQA